MYGQNPSTFFSFFIFCLKKSVNITITDAQRAAATSSVSSMARKCSRSKARVLVWMQVSRPEKLRYRKSGGADSKLKIQDIEDMCIYP